MYVFTKSCDAVISLDVIVESVEILSVFEYTYIFVVAEYFGVIAKCVINPDAMAARIVMIIM